MSPAPPPLGGARSAAPAHLWVLAACVLGCLAYGLGPRPGLERASLAAPASPEPAERGPGVEPAAPRAAPTPGPGTDAGTHPDLASGTSDRPGAPGAEPGGRPGPLDRP